MIRFENVHKAFGERRILRGITFRVAEGETYVLMGASGTGKSTALRHIVGLLVPDEGTVAVDGQEVASLDRKGLMRLRSRMGYLFQSGALINWLTVFENVALPLRERTRMTEGEIEARVKEKLGMVGMEEHGALLPDQISGGMRKRAALARALVTDPAIVLYDEPTAGLDPVMAETSIRLIASVQERLAVTSVVVTHHRGCAMKVGNRIGLMDEGVIVEEGAPEEMRRSEHPLVRSFLSGLDE